MQKELNDPRNYCGHLLTRKRLNEEENVGRPRKLGDHERKRVFRKVRTPIKRA